MIFHIAADLVVLLHFLFICFVVAGGLLALKWPRVLFLHLPAALWGMLIEFYGWICPLTPLEQYFRIRAGSAGYSVGFIEHYLLPVIYPTGLTREIQIILGFAVVLINLVIYVLVFFRYKHYRKKHDPKPTVKY